MRFAFLFAALMIATAPIPSTGECTCARDKLVNGWCGNCARGYIAGVEIRSHVLFDALDAHGHNVPPERLDCMRCREAVKTGGYCPGCRIGFVDGKAYFSKLTWLLGRGEAVDPATLACETCTRTARHATLPLPPEGWCEACGAGMVGNVRYRDRETFEAARAEFALLLKAIARSEECGLCGAALFLGTSCRRCGITYRDGEPVQP